MQIHRLFLGFMCIFRQIQRHNQKNRDMFGKMGELQRIGNSRVAIPVSAPWRCEFELQTILEVNSQHRNSLRELQAEGCLRLSQWIKKNLKNLKIHSYHASKHYCELETMNNSLPCQKVLTSPMHCCRSSNGSATFQLLSPWNLSATK